MPSGGKNKSMKHAGYQTAFVVWFQVKMCIRQMAAVEFSCQERFTAISSTCQSQEGASPWTIRPHANYKKEYSSEGRMTVMRTDNTYFSGLVQ